MLSKLKDFLKTKVKDTAIKAAAAVYAAAKGGIAAFLAAESPASHASLADLAKSAAVFVAAYIGSHATGLVPGDPLAQAIVAAVAYMLQQMARGPKPPTPAPVACLPSQYKPWTPTTMPAVEPGNQA